MDSGPLYIAQALRVPAVSVWGTHHPGVRIGYDNDYMELAVWNHEVCKWSPCYAYAGFPDGKCPNGSKQMTCEVLNTVTPQHVMDRLDKVQARKVGVTSFPAGKAEVSQSSCSEKSSQA
jgi:hypothetical protein